MNQGDILRNVVAQMSPAQREQLALRYQIPNDPWATPGPMMHQPGQDAQTLYAKMRKLQLQGHTVNLCPYGCNMENLDANGYCRHLVGFTTDGKEYEPLKMVKKKLPDGTLLNRGRFVQLTRPRREVGRDEEGEIEYEEGPPKLSKVQPDDAVIYITTTARVYRNHEKLEQEAHGKKGKSNGG